GRLYPADMLAASALDAEAVRGSEDDFVDDLIAAAPAHGAAVLQANFARPRIDLICEPYVLDPVRFEAWMAEFALARTARVAAGLGSIARIVAEGREIYARKLTFAEASHRIEAVHRPYHDALTRLLAAARGAHGLAILVDWHSMPSAAADHARPV